MGTAQLAFREVTGTGNHGRDRVRMRNNLPRFFSYYSSSTVVQVPGLPEVTKGHVTPFGVHLGVRMRNWKLRNIRPSGDF